jgi:hypothetical protein
MRRKLSIVLTMLMVLCLSATTLYAANVRITSVSFSLGSLIADGTMDGFDPNQSAKVNLQANGIGKVFCHPAQGKALGPYQVTIVATGAQSIQADAYGLSGFHVETGTTKIKNFTCAPGTTPELRHELWSAAVITVKDPATQTLLLTQSYTCSQGPETIYCTPDE